MVYAEYVQTGRESQVRVFSFLSRQGLGLGRARDGGVGGSLDALNSCHLQAPSHTFCTSKHSRIGMWMENTAPVPQSHSWAVILGGQAHSPTARTFRNPLILCRGMSHWATGIHHQRNGKTGRPEKDPQNCSTGQDRNCVATVTEGSNTGGNNPIIAQPQQLTARENHTVAVNPFRAFQKGDLKGTVKSIDQK